MLDSKLKLRVAAALATVAVLAIAAGAAAQDAAKPAPATAPPPETAAGVRLTHPGAFEIHVQGADLRAVLQLLSTQGRKNIIATKEVTGSVTADLYGVTFKEALEAVLRASGFVYEEKGNFIYVYTPKQLDDIRKSERKMGVKFFRLAFVTADDAAKMILPALSGEGSISVSTKATNGISPSKVDAGGNNLGIEDVIIIRDYEDNLAAVSELIREIDVKPQQVMIEATILRAMLTENNDLGIDFNILSGIDFSALAPESNALTNLTFPTAAAGATLDRSAATFRTDLRHLVPSGGATIGFISNEVALFVRALESVTDTTVLANPKLLVVNKQCGSVMVGNRDGYLTTTFTDSVATQTVQFLETGTRLIVRPFIGRDGYIRMEIHPEDSIGTVKQVGSAVLPSEKTTEVTTNVLVRDGHTIVVGGLFRESTKNSRSQVPVLGNIPHLGALFRHTGDETIREEVIILITPRIVQQDIAEAVGAEMRDDVERFRVGQRKGLMWWGRSRLANCYMSFARDHANKGQVARALWNLDCALSLQPRNEEAINLKERLTNKAYWSDQTRYSAVKYTIDRMMMRDLGLPVELMIPPSKPRSPELMPEEVQDEFGYEPAPQRLMPSEIRRLRSPAPAAPAEECEVEETVEVEAPAEAVEVIEGDSPVQTEDAAVEEPAGQGQEEGVAGAETPAEA